jgi:hypothetical protein
MDRKAFRKLTLQQRFNELQTDGEFIGSRKSFDHFVSLYAFHGFFVEVYFRVGLNCVSMIEVQDSKLILDEYAAGVSIKQITP